VIVLDTHIWIWWSAESARLPKKTATALGRSVELGVPTICCWEVAMLVSKGRLTLSMDVLDWLQLALERPKIQLLPLTPEVSAMSMQLPGTFHGDPADRLIVATALTLKQKLATQDQAIRDWGRVQVV
jgi:PIN domain nuclease of toxin-antitoxin system